MALSDSLKNMKPAVKYGILAAIIVVVITVIVVVVIVTTKSDKTGATGSSKFSMKDISRVFNKK